MAYYGNIYKFIIIAISLHQSHLHKPKQPALVRQWSSSSSTTYLLLIVKRGEGYHHLSCNCCWLELNWSLKEVVWHWWKQNVIGIYWGRTQYIFAFRSPQHIFALSTCSRSGNISTSPHSPPLPCLSSNQLAPEVTVPKSTDNPALEKGSVKILSCLFPSI